MKFIWVWKRGGGYRFQEFEGIKVLNSTRESYSGRLIDYLNYIQSSFVLIILDDFIIENKVDNEILQRYADYIFKNPDVACMSLSGGPMEGVEKYQTGVVKRPWNADYLLNLQVAIWDKAVLLSLLKDGESPWQIELFGSFRARKLKNKIFLQLEDSSFMPIVYNGGWLIVKGIWNGNEIKRLKLEKYVNEFLDGKTLKYDNFGRLPKTDVLKIRWGILIRKLASKLGVYF